MNVAGLAKLDSTPPPSERKFDELPAPRKTLETKVKVLDHPRALDPILRRAISGLPAPAPSELPTFSGDHDDEKPHIQALQRHISPPMLLPLVTVGVSLSAVGLLIWNVMRKKGGDDGKRSEPADNEPVFIV